MRSWLCSGICITLVAMSSTVHAITPAAAQSIEHLIGHIRSSGCTFLRNGNAYDSVKAAEHIRDKYVYLKDRIETVDEFIKAAATRSSMSGDPYMIQCPGQPAKPAAEWLHIELRRYKAQAAQPAR